jgi:hypothetical protein
MKQLSPGHLKAALLYKGTLMLRRFFTAVGIVLCFRLMSCDLFKTRTPEEPSQQSSTYVPPTDVSLVLPNMVSAFQDGDVGHYLLSFSDAAFIFEPSTKANSKYGNTWLIWSKVQEQQYFDNIQSNLQNNSKATLVFSQTIYGIPSDICDVTTLYQLEVPLKNAVGVKTFKGQAQFQLIRDSKTSDWSIQKWGDSDPGSNASDSTWSDLKGAFAQ